ncbi:peptidyl-prolyl cis-trans isomerase D [Parelusimicrobium proximum]|uniref:peptidylprolyl isomerase n=1 Tax=Parelusimicrobium proximum TaxID=3228953 RepID=UPI003D16A3B0
MIKIKKILALVIFGIMCVSANAVVLNQTVATVNDEPILRSDFDKMSSAYIKQIEAQNNATLKPEGKTLVEKEILGKMIEDELLFQAAEKAKIVVREDEVNAAYEDSKSQLIAAFEQSQGGKKLSEKDAAKKFKEILKEEGLSEKQFKLKLKKQIAVRKLVQTMILPTAKQIEEKDVRAFYDDVMAFLKKNQKKMDAVKDPAYKQELMLTASRLHMLAAEQVRIGHIFFPVAQGAKPSEIKEAENKAKAAKKEIDGGADFGVVARKYSDGQDMVLVKGQAPKSIDDKAFTLAVGKVSEPIRTEIGYHIIKVKEKRAEEEITFEKVGNEFAQYLMAKNAEEAINAYVSDLKSKAVINITAEDLKDKPAAEEKKEEKKADDKTADKKAEVKKEAKK